MKSLSFLSLALLLSLQTVIAQTTRNKKQNDSYMMLAQVVNDKSGNQTAEKVSDLLQKHGIDCAIAGSAGLSINVFKKDLNKAQDVLWNAIEAEEIDVELYLSNNGWPTSIGGLMAHLNKWDKSELDAHERPEAYPNFKSSGETNGWVQAHKDQLAELNAEVIWNADKQRYELEKN